MVKYPVNRYTLKRDVYNILLQCSDDIGSNVTCVVGDDVHYIHLVVKIIFDELSFHNANIISNKILDLYMDNVVEELKIMTVQNGKFAICYKINVNAFKYKEEL